MPARPLRKSAIWNQLVDHHTAFAPVSLAHLFDADPQRFEHFSARLGGLILDYSKNHLSQGTLKLLMRLAEEAGLPAQMAAMKNGEKINRSENRAVLHTALRLPKSARLLLDGRNIVADVHRELNRALAFAEKVRSGAHLGYYGQSITDVVNIGIGGSDLGPQMLTLALKPFQGALRVHFVANIDPAALAQTLAPLDPQRTLFIVASKSFGTLETLQNALAARRWFHEKLPQTDAAAIAHHFVAVSSNIEAAVAFGIEKENVFGMFDWVGGRYSVWSTIGLPVMMAIGAEAFLQFLEGGRAMDKHFFNTPLHKNLPVLLGMIGIWYSDFHGAATHAILPYDHGLRRFPAHIQQVDMESNGKSRTRTGTVVEGNTGTVVWGEEGTNSQHAFFQLLHQGTRLTPCDFIITLKSSYEDEAHRHRALVANALAQTRALMVGKSSEEVKQELAARTDLSPEALGELIPQKVFSGNRPSTTIALEEITPYNLGMLLALYEHKVFVQGAVWGVNSFDQWGVELGKVLAQDIEPNMTGEHTPAYDSSTNGLIAAYRKAHHG